MQLKIRIGKNINNKGNDKLSTQFNTSNSFNLIIKIIVTKINSKHLLSTAFYKNLKLGHIDVKKIKFC